MVSKHGEYSRTIQNTRDNDGQRVSENVQTSKNEHVQETSKHATNKCVTSSTEQNEQEIEIALALQNWSGLLPPPEYFNAYDEKTKEYIYKWTDTTIIGESKRQDKIVRIKAVSDFLSVFFTLAVVIVIGVCFTITRDPAIFGLLSIPLFTACINIVFINKNKDNNKK